MNSDFLRLSRRVTELEKGISKDAGSFLRNDSRFLNSSGEVELGSNVNNAIRGGTHSTGSSNFPSAYGQYWHFSGGTRARDLTLWTQNGGENLYFQTYDYPDGNPQGWNEIWHSGNLEPVAITSANRPGVTKLYRKDHNSGYNVQTWWTGSYWKLDGYNGDTYHAPCSVYHADHAGDADKLDGYNSAEGSTGNTIVKRHKSGYIYATYYNTTAGTVGNVQPYWIYCGNTASGDNFIRRIPFSYLANRINGYGSAKNSHTHSYLPLSGGTCTGVVKCNSWFYAYGQHGIFFASYGGGLYMTDSTWIRTYNGKKFYCSSEMKSEYLTINDILFVGNTNQSYTACIDKAEYTQVTFRPNADGKGNLGSGNYTWDQCIRRSASTGSSRTRKELIRLYDTESAYDTVKDTQIYSFRFKAEEIKDDEVELLKNTLGREPTEEELNPVHTNYYNLGVMADQAPLEILNTYTADDTHINIDNSIFLTMAALQHAQKRIEILEQRVEELENGVT